MAQKQPIKTTTNADATSKSLLNLPSPQAFDILPLLHEYLAQVDVHFNQDVPPDERPHEEGNDDIGATYGGEKGKPLNPKELPAKVSDVKQRIRQAQRELEKLPDMDRTVQEQEEEIQELQDRIRRQREMLKGLASFARTMEERLP
ncbi:uncharacterized protein MYCFIDRAFT_79143 [Pseudocercospora fijiensis CIRAD86]|uniref:Mediator of RNA polymerase II transcription subunit 9 n=1 Tax=Pseudocercospora fijiensis (strain CIRAD86) TaxID=383855 RepID=M3AL63_PSEFD|nr:uncharacterized protein MYCFIDRAFT_79143 [Pseudocercospora fijiensis CIRAD86]EME77893.1 hypothetical protein MYCFIDRAFT_79143 [Pseudocercospora fijiensis CIRAD86]